jgi:uncharacterized protein with GYD domain
LGKYDTLVFFETPDEKTAIIIALKRMDRKDIITLVAVPGDENHPSGPI